VTVTRKDELVFCRPMSATPQSRAPLRVLIIEDNRDVRTTLRMLLSMGYGYVVYEAADGASGVRAALDEKPDAALIDLGLPDIDGYEVARRIRARLDRDSILLIALTGYGDIEDQQRTQAAGFDIHLVKPVDSAALVQTLERSRK
jgi:CheY-like chemotaxis protein